MCGFCADLVTLAARAGRPLAEAQALADGLVDRFPGMVVRRGDVIVVTAAGRPLTPVIAHGLDRYDSSGIGHIQVL